MTRFPGLSRARAVLAASCLLGATIATIATTAAAQTLELEVVDGAGRPIEGAEACVHAAGDETFDVRWIAAESGIIRVESLAEDAEAAEGEGDTGALPAEGEVDCVVRAPGHAPRILRIALPQDGPHRVELSVGRRVELTLGAHDGGELPTSLRPTIVGFPYGMVGWITLMTGAASTASPEAFSLATVDALGDGRFAFHVTDDLPALHVLVTEPGYLRFFQSEAFTSDDWSDGELRVDLPEPATIRAALSVPEEAEDLDYRECGASASLFLTLPGGEDMGFGLIKDVREQREISVAWDDLAPGSYSIDVFTMDPEPESEWKRTAYEDSSWADLASGDEHVFTTEWAQFDPTVLEGDYAAVVTVTNFDGSPAAGLEYTLSYYDDRFGRKLVREGTLPDDGVVSWTGVPGGDAAHSLSFSVDGMRMRAFDLSGEERERALTLALPPREGDLAPEIDLVHMDTEESLLLSSYRGQVVLLDFWATWCGPCQGPMEHSNEILSRRADDWSGRATILGISIDDEIGELREHVARKQWDRIPHLWVEGAWKSDAVTDYGISGVPTALLLDTEGRIVWRGHPNSLDVEERIDALLASGPRS